MIKSTFQILLALSGITASGQGFIYDQQSADENHYMEGGAGLGQQPIGQSFTPILNNVGFIRIYLVGGAFGGATFAMNLRSDSITGTILGSSEPVTQNSSGPANFIFETPLSVTPGTTYYFQPVIQSGAGWGAFVSSYNYPGGTAFVDGLAVPTSDFWFREGVVVPEPQSWALLLVGAGVLFYSRHFQARKNAH
jgi:hypothetical protein